MDRQAVSSKRLEPAVQSAAIKLRQAVAEVLPAEQIEGLPEARRRPEIRTVIEHVMKTQKLEPLDSLEREALIEAVLDEYLGLGPIEPLMHDPDVSDILVNAPDEVYVERNGVLEETAVRFADNKHIRSVIERIVSRIGRRIDDMQPLVDARLVDGSRVNAVIPPLAIKGPTLSIRRFPEKPLDLSDLLRFEALTREMAMVLEAAVRGRLNVIVSGGTGSGKTTLLNVLSSFISPKERIVTIEDAAELQLQQRHVVPLETRAANLDGKGEITARTLVRNTLRMRPDRIIVGECRGVEALDMLTAMNTGHEGSLTTIHANSTRDALTRLETMLLMGGFDLPLKAMRRQMASAIHVVVQTDRLAGGVRKITDITEVTGMEGEIITSQEIFVYRRRGVDGNGRVVGQFEATGVRPKFAHRLQAAGIDLPIPMFAQRIL